MWYGAKVRAPHAFVMTLLFKSNGSMMELGHTVVQATWSHSRNLGVYVGLFKLLRCVLRMIRRVESPLNTLLAGFGAGYLIFGDNTPVNAQMNMYVMSRVILGSVSALVKHHYLPTLSNAYPLFAGICWAMVMYLHSYHYNSLQKSLAVSMDFLYNDSEKWPRLNDASHGFLMALFEWFWAEK